MDVDAEEELVDYEEDAPEVMAVDDASSSAPVQPPPVEIAIDDDAAMASERGAEDAAMSDDEGSAPGDADMIEEPSREQEREAEVEMQGEPSAPPELARIPSPTSLPPVPSLVPTVEHLPAEIQGMHAEADSVRAEAPASPGPGATAGREAVHEEQEGVDASGEGGAGEMRAETVDAEDEGEAGDGEVDERPEESVGGKPREPSTDGEAEQVNVNNEARADALPERRDREEGGDAGEGEPVSEPQEVDGIPEGGAHDDATSETERESENGEAAVKDASVEHAAAQDESAKDEPEDGEVPEHVADVGGEPEAEDDGPGDVTHYHDAEEDPGADDQDGDSASSSTLEPLPPIVLALEDGSRRALFSASPSVPDVLLADLDLAHAPLASLFAALRSALPWDDGDEAVLHERSLDLRVGEDNRHADEVTLGDLADLHRRCNVDEPMVLHLELEPGRFISKVAAIRQVLDEAEARAADGEYDSEWEGDAVEDDDFGVEAAIRAAEDGLQSPNPSAKRAREAEDDEADRHVKPRVEDEGATAEA